MKRRPENHAYSLKSEQWESSRNGAARRAFLAAPLIAAFGVAVAPPASGAVVDTEASTDASIAALLAKPNSLSRAATNTTVVQKAAAGLPELAVDGRANVGALKFKPTMPGALMIVDTLGTNGRRLSIQPDDQHNSTYSAQFEIAPGANVPPGGVTAQILMYNKVGANYERFVTSASNGEYQFHSSRLGAGRALPTFFYVNNVPSTAWMGDSTFRVYSRIEFYSKADGAARASIQAVSAGVLSTEASLRIAEGTTSQVRIGNTTGVGRPGISFGSDGLVHVSRNGANIEVAGASVKIAGGIGVNGAAVVGKQSLAPPATSPATTQALANQLRAALIKIGFAR
jgi:hypothetical protein